MRRAVALLSMLLMFHLTLVSGSRACVTHARATAAAPAQPQHHGAHHGGKQENCDTPATSTDCCPSQPSCAPGLALTTARLPAPQSGARIASRETFALSRSSAPETPPPRA